jgi:hypothetical protein
MGFLMKWIVNIFIMVVVFILIFAFFPTIWNLIWSLTPGIYRPLFIAGLIIVCGLPALRSGEY